MEDENNNHAMKKRKQEILARPTEVSQFQNENLSIGSLWEPFQKIRKISLGNFPSSGQPLIKKANASNVFEAQMLLKDAMTAKTQATNQADLDQLKFFLLRSYFETLEEFNKQLNDESVNKIANGLQKQYGWQIFLIPRIYVEKSNEDITVILNNYFKSLVELNFENMFQEYRVNIQEIKNTLQDVKEKEGENVRDEMNRLIETANQTDELLNGFQPKVNEKWFDIIKVIYAVNSESTRAINAARALLENKTELISEMTNGQYTPNREISMAQVPYYMALWMNSSPQGTNVEQRTVTVPLNPYNVIQSVLAGMVAKTLFKPTSQQSNTIEQLIPQLDAFLQNLKSGVLIDENIAQVLCEERVIKSAFNPYKKEFINACQVTKTKEAFQEALKKLMDFKPPPWRTATVRLPSPTQTQSGMEIEGDKFDMEEV